MPGYTFDLKRIFLGDLPLVFLGEVVFRTIILYLFALAMMRLSGKRSSAQLTPVDVLIIVALGSSVGDPMFYPDVPLLHGMVVISLVVFMRRVGVWWGDQSDRVYDFIEGVPVRLVADGQIDVDSLRSAAIAHDEVLELVREQGVKHLGLIERLYLENDGHASLFLVPEGEARAGLPVLPPRSLDGQSSLSRGEEVAHSGAYACAYCGLIGHLAAGDVLPGCPKCGHQHWVPAMSGTSS